MKQIIRDYLKKYFIYIILIIAVIVFYLLNNKEIEPIKEDIAIESKEKIELIKIDIKGAIKNPGVYELPINSRVSDAIDISGGLIDISDTSTINLSKVLVNEMVIIIYTKDEINEMKKGSTSIKYIENECICPQIKNDACIEESITNIETENNTENNNKININECSKEELLTLKGIGEAKANLIIEYRNNTKFNSIEDIMNVKGIGNSIYEKIKDSITV